MNKRSEFLFWSAVVASIFFSIVVLSFGSFYIYRYFAPRTEAGRRDVFEQSKAYNQGMVQELQNMAFEYAKAEPQQKAALASIILHRTADYDVNRLPRDLRDFIDKLRTDRLQGGNQ